MTYLCLAKLGPNSFAEKLTNDEHIWHQKKKNKKYLKLNINFIFL